MAPSLGKKPKTMLTSELSRGVNYGGDGSPRSAAACRHFVVGRSIDRARDRCRPASKIPVFGLERSWSSSSANRVSPSRIQACGFPSEVPQAHQDHRPGELDHGSEIVAGDSDCDIEVVRALRVGGGVARSRRGDQLALRQLRPDLPCAPSAFTHDADHVEGAKRLNHCRGIGDVAVEHADLRRAVPPTSRRASAPCSGSRPGLRPS